MQKMMDGLTSAKCKTEVGKDKGESVRKVYQKMKKKASFPLINFGFLQFPPFPLGANPTETLHFTLILTLMDHSNNAQGNYMLNFSILVSQKTHGNRC